MKQEFATVYGKVIIENNTLFIRSMYLPFSKTAFAQIAFAFFWPVGFGIQFFREDGPSKYFRIIIWGALLLGNLPQVYDRLFKRSYATRIPLHHISSFSTEDDLHGLQTTVTLQLRNGRYKKLLFRKLENQVEPFINVVSQYLYPLQPA